MIKGAKIFTFNAFQANCIVLWDNNNECVFFDPCFCEENEKAKLLNLVKEEGLKPSKILLTHCHFDHIYGVKALVDVFGIPVYLGAADKALLPLQAELIKGFGIPEPNINFETVDLKDGDVIEVGEMKFKVLATPGHTPGGVCYYNEDDKILVSGDTLFAGSIGRSDLPGGDYDALIKGIFEKLLVLDGDTDVLPGHGGYSTISDERTKNPFLLPFNEPFEEDEKKD